MAVKLRLKRMGKKGHPFYRVVAADARSPRDGRIIEAIGIYDPKNGAQPSDTVRNLLSKEGIMKKLHDEKNAK